MPRDKELTVEQMDNHAQRTAKKIFNERVEQENKLLKVKETNIKKLSESEKQMVKDYTKARSSAEEELKEVRDGLMSLSFREYADLYGKTMAEAEKELTEIRKKELKRSVQESNAKALAGVGIEKDADGKTQINMGTITSNLGKTTDNIVRSALNTYTSYQARVNTRLIGYVDQSNNAFKRIVDSTNKSSPFYRTSDYMANINKLVEEGIVQNVEQRAFLETIKDEIVTTFEATNTTLERLVRIQNQDSTAARAGMEAYLTAFLNKEFENSEYITDQFKTTSALLEEATALLSAEQATSFEYVVQKWLGALYSEGMSSSGVQSLATAIGQLASGNINSLVGSPIGNLVAMASKGNLATYFKEGLTEASADILMQSIVQYLQELNSSGNNVVRSQLANVFGLSISDLMAASNVNATGIAGGNLSYAGAEGYLGSLMGTASSRMNTASIIDNLVSNLGFSLGSQLAESTALYSIYKAGDVIGELLPGFKVGGGILPFEAELSSLVKLVALGGSVGSLLGDLIGGASFYNGSLLDTFTSIGALNKSSSKSWGSGLLSKNGTSSSGFIGNANSSNLMEGSLGGFKDFLSSNKSTVTGKSDEESIDVVVPNIYKYLVNTLDNKLDILIKIGSSQSNYSVVDAMGNNLMNSMNTIMNGNQVMVRANPEEKEDLTKSISDNVAGIYDILSKIVTGEMQVSIRDTSAAGMYQINNSSGIAWTGARYV